MKLPTRLINNDLSDDTNVPQLRRLSAFGFFKKYPIFLLAFGPPIFRPLKGVDITRGQVDIWGVFQVGLIVLVAIPASIRMGVAGSITIPVQIRPILKLAFYLGILFMLSTVYSTNRLTTVAYSICYFLTLICMVELIVQVYRNPPNWMQSLYQLRLLAFCLFILVILTLFYNSGLVLNFEEARVRLLGGGIAPIPIICPIITIISAHSFLHNLESRVRSTFFIIVGLAGTMSARSRGSEVALLVALTLVVMFWAMSSRRMMYVFISGLILIIFIALGLVEVIGADRIWNIFNRGENVSGIASASGRTYIWSFVLRYCIYHPWGMGYVAGFRTIFRNYYSLGMPVVVSSIGNAHNSYVQVLADAGWLALTVYLMMIARIVFIGWRAARGSSLKSLEYGCAPSHVMACALALLIFCLVCGITGADFVVPMRASYYFQNIIIAIILGAHARALIVVRTMSRSTNGSYSGQQRFIGLR
jgi:O-antigen ligase